MKKNYLVSVVLIFGFLVACGNVESPNEPENENTTNEEAAVSELNGETQESNELVVEEEAVAESNSDGFVIAFLDVCFNGADEENKESLLDEMVDSEVRELFNISCSFSEDNKIPNPTIEKTVEVDLEDGSEGSAHLVTSENDKEVIVLLRNEKIGWVYDNAEDIVKMKSEFGL